MTATITVRPATEEDCIFLGPRLRQEDKDEVMAAIGHTPEAALMAGLQLSTQCYTAEIDGVPFGMFGVCNDLDAHEVGVSFGRIWYLGTNDMLRARKEFMRLSRDWVEHLGRDYEIIGNHCDARNRTHVRWLGAMGFQFLSLDPVFGYERRPFLYFSRVMETSSV